MKQFEHQLPICDATIQSSARVMEGLRRDAYLEHRLSNDALPFTQKQADYLSGFDRILNSRNFRLIMDCRGEMDAVNLE